MLHLPRLVHGRVPWEHPLVLRVVRGSLTSVALIDRAGTVIDGHVESSGARWVSEGRLQPLQSYVVHAMVREVTGATVPRSLTFRTTKASRHLTALLSPGDGNVVGVGSPVIIRLSRPVPTNQRAMVEHRLAVSTQPYVVGAWHWITPQELHWRPPTYWKAHTAVTVSSNLDGLYLGHGVWGQGSHSASFRIGPSHISRVDVARHQMYVYENRHLIRTFPISAGRDQYPTKNGVHITFEKSQVVTMDSATVGIPRNSPDGYYEKVYWDVRISYGGAFVHAAPWSVAQQGISNVSHGCVNLSVSNAIWFYNWSLRGDVVDVYNSAAAPDLGDPGMADWNMSWKEWVAGDAAPTGAALHAHARMPHDADPPAPKSTVTTQQPPPPPPPSSPSPTPSHHHSPSPSPSPSASPHRHHH
ncbi:MAG: L,D-transpeptidase family protein [Frankiales bacterium]|nr:L,D-transpeptidase family protein [Frankiales bacterium]